MVALLKRLFNKDEDENIRPSELNTNEKIRFTLKIDDLHIGYLYAEDGLWYFRYSDDFINQNQYARLTGFSDLHKIYKSEELWPFFKIRIPGLKQPMIKDIIKSEKLDGSNEAVLLRRFGWKSMSNPYLLEPV
jgi:hypothetical protein